MASTTVSDSLSRHSLWRIAAPCATGIGTAIARYQDQILPGIALDVVWMVWLVNSRRIERTLSIAVAGGMGAVCGDVLIQATDSARQLGLWDSLMTLLILVGVSYSTAGWVAADRRARRFSTRDPLTGLYNRQGMEELLTAELSRAHRFQQPLAVAILDGDAFKAVNDRMGHVSGDRMLVQAAEIIRKNLRAYDHCARWGGDEFIVLLPQCDLPATEAILRRLQIQLQQIPCEIAQGIRFSMGAVVVRHPLTAEQLLHLADERMYAAKGTESGIVIEELSKSPAPLPGTG